MKYIPYIRHSKTNDLFKFLHNLVSTWTSFRSGLDFPEQRMIGWSIDRVKNDQQMAKNWIMFFLWPMYWLGFFNVNLTSLIPTISYRMLTVPTAISSSFSLSLSEGILSPLPWLIKHDTVTSLLSLPTLDKKEFKSRRYSSNLNVLECFSRYCGQSWRISNEMKLQVLPDRLDKVR